MRLRKFNREKKQTDFYICFNFNPHKISIDFSKVEYAVIKFIYKDVIIIPCFIHFIHNIIKKISNIRSKNKKEKKLSRDLLAVITLLCFINKSFIYEFYELIEKNMKKNLKIFLNIFLKHILKKAL